jgi:hypothetical protein
MDMDAHQIAQRELMPGETLRWAGRPTPHAAALAKDNIQQTLIGIIPMILCVPATGLSVLFVMTFIQVGFDPMGMMVVLFLVGVSAAVIFAWVWLMSSIPRAWLSARHMIYGVTDWRVFIATSSPRRVVQSLPIARTSSADRIDGADGYGTLIFQRERRAQPKGYKTIEHGFYGIPEVRKVEGLIAELKRKATADQAR